MAKTPIDILISGDNKVTADNTNETLSNILNANTSTPVDQLTSTSTVNIGGIDLSLSPNSQQQSSQNGLLDVLERKFTKQPGESFLGVVGDVLSLPQVLATSTIEKVFGTDQRDFAQLVQDNLRPSDIIFPEKTNGFLKFILNATLDPLVATSFLKGGGLALSALEKLGIVEKGTAALSSFKKFENFLNVIEKSSSPLKKTVKLSRNIKDSEVESLISFIENRTKGLASRLNAASNESEFSSILSQEGNKTISALKLLSLKTGKQVHIGKLGDIKLGGIIREAAGDKNVIPIVTSDFPIIKDQKFLEMTPEMRTRLKDVVSQLSELDDVKSDVIPVPVMMSMAKEQRPFVRELIKKGIIEQSQLTGAQTKALVDVFAIDYADKFISSLGKDPEALKVFKAVVGKRAEKGRDLLFLKLPTNLQKSVVDSLRSAMKAPGVTAEQLDKLTEMAKIIGLDKGTLNPTKVMKFVEFATMNKLTGFGSIFTKQFVGQTFMTLIGPFERGIQGTLDFTAFQLARMFGKEPVREVFAKEGLAQFMGIAHAFKNANHAFISFLRSPTDYWKEVKSTEILTRFGAIGQGGAVGEFLDKSLREFTKGRIGFDAGEIVRLPARIIGAIDIWFKQLAEGGEIYSLAWRKAMKLNAEKGGSIIDHFREIIQNPSEDIVNLAKEAGKKVTFQETMTGIAKNINQIRSQFPLVRLFLPFFNTPVNIFREGLKRAMPLMWSRSVVQFLKGEIGKEVFLEDMAKAITGMVALTEFGLYASRGGITSRGPKSKAERNVLRAAGWQPNSILINGKYVSYLGFDPISSWLRIVGDFAESGRRSENFADGLQQAMFSYLKQFAENPFFMGVDDILEGLSDPEHKGTQFMSGLISGAIIPVALQQWGARVFDPVVRQPRTFAQRIAARTPISSQVVIPRRDIFGQIVLRDHPISQALGFTVSDKRTDNIKVELARLGVGISLPDKKIRGEKLTDKQFDRFYQLQGFIMKKLLDRSINSDYYRLLNDEGKKDFIEKQVSKVKRMATQQFMDKYYRETILF